MKTPYLAAMILLFATTNCGRMNTAQSNPAAAPSEKAPSTTDPGGAEKACEAILSKKEASLFADGKQPKVAVASDVVGPLICKHVFVGKDEVAAGINVVVTNAAAFRKNPYVSPEWKVRSAAMSDSQLISEWLAEAVKQNHGVPVPGIGDGAWELIPFSSLPAQEQPMSNLYFRTKNTMVSVEIYLLPRAPERSIKIAKLIQGRIPN